MTPTPTSTEYRPITCPRCRTINVGILTACGNCEAELPKPAMRECPACKLINVGPHVHCLRCGRELPE